MVVMVTNRVMIGSDRAVTMGSLSEAVDHIHDLM